MLLTQEQEMIRDMARDFARRRLAPHSAEWERTSTFPKDALKEMGALGFLGMTVPTEWGGANADYVAYALALEEIAAGDGAVSTIMSGHNSVGCMPILEYGTILQKETYLRPMASGAQLCAFCVTDPGAGKRGISAFIVETSRPRYRVGRIEKKMGQNASDTCEIHFDDLELPVENRLGEEGQGYRIALSNLEGGRIGIAAQSIGMARAALEIAIAYAQERQSFGKAIIEHQAVAFRLADMATGLEAARQLVLHAAALRSQGLPCLREASMAKLFATETAERICSDAIQTLGGAGYMEDFGVERIFRAVRGAKIYEGTNDIQRLVISRSLVS